MNKPKNNILGYEYKVAQRLKQSLEELINIDDSETNFKTNKRIKPKHKKPPQPYYSEKQQNKKRYNYHKDLDTPKESFNTNTNSTISIANNPDPTYS